MRFNWKALAFLVLLLLAWQAIAQANLVNPTLFPSPTVVFEAGINWFQSGQMANDVSASFVRLIAGLLIGSSLGVMIGVLMGRILFLEETTGPFLHILRAFPAVAVIPLVIVWLGIGDLAKIFSIAFGVFFPVWISALVGAKSIPREYLRVAKVYSKKTSDTFLRIYLPATLPFLVNGIRIGIGIGFIMVFVSELAGASSGLGYFIAKASQIYRIDSMVAGLIVLGSLSALTDFAFVSVIKKKFSWMDLE